MIFFCLVSVPVHVNIHLSESKKIPRAEALGFFDHIKFYFEIKLFRD